MHVPWSNGGGSGFDLPGNLVGALLLCAVTITGLWSWRRRGLAGGRSLFFLFAGSGVLMLPWLWSASPYREAATLRLLGLGLGALALLALYQVPLDRARRRQWLYGLLVAGVLEALLGLMQYAGIWPGGAPVSGGVPRPYGIFQQWNVMASFMAITLALSLVLAGQPGGGWGARGVRAVAQLLTPLLLVIIVSRIGLLAALILTPLQLIGLWRQSPVRGAWVLCRVALGAVLGLALLAENGAPRAPAQSSTLSYRNEAARTAVTMIAEKPWFGWGYGHFEGDFIRTYHTWHPQASLSFRLSHPHNELLLWGVEGGALALTGCCLMAAGLWRRMRRDARGGFWRLGGRPWIAALPALLHLMVEYPLYLSAAHGVALLILWRVSEGRQVGRLPELASGILRIMGSVMAGLCALYLANGLYSAQRVMMVERGGLRDLPTLERLPQPTPWAARRAYDLALARLLRYPQTHDPQALVQYQHWAKDAQRVSPDVTVYLNLAAIARLQGKPAEAEQQLTQARHLFPDDPRLPPERP
ncbi:PglL family O-oligosaccharyltransferase [Serratia rubidaea]|uniref:PglL family O-oligosaccharyltransferase n=1 Tax=Serratia rubidaea TaxID=61652 RepID=UPI001F193D7A|nr:Wzy polymerase domain-containing protein [Serratia rubidaea]